MFKQNRTTMAIVLVGAGYSPSAALSAVKYPKCIALTIDNGAGVAVTVYDESGASSSYEADSNGVVKLSPFVYPRASYLAFAGNLTIRFTFSDRSFLKLHAFQRLSVPTPPMWGDLTFYEELYPPEV